MPQRPSSAQVDDVPAISIDDVINPHVKMGVDYWRSLCGPRRFPARGELTLRGMAPFLPYIVILSVIDDGADYEYRFVGDAQMRAFGIPFKGIRVSQIEAAIPQLGALLRGAYGQVLSMGTAFAVRGRVGHVAPDSEFLYHESAFLPLGASDARVDHLLIVGVSVPKPFWDLPAEKLAIVAEQIHPPAVLSRFGQ